MAVYQLADLPVQIEGAGAYTSRVLSAYQAVGTALRCSPELSISVTSEMVERERQLEGNYFDRDYLECMSVYRAFCEKALRYDVLFFHASAVALDGEAYLFTGPSGIGKSTHARMWREAFGRDVVMINDDKPLLRFYQDGIYACGTPWDGKHHLNTDIKIKVKGICLLEQAACNEIRRLGFTEAKQILQQQAFHAQTWEHRQAVERLVNRMLNCVPVYRLRCSISTQAAWVAHQGMAGNI